MECLCLLEANVICKQHFLSIKIILKCILQSMFCPLQVDLSIHSSIRLKVNMHKYAIAVKNEAQLLVGHVPRELSKIFSRFLGDYGDIETECIGVRYNRGEGKGLEIPVNYRLTGNSSYLEKLVTSLKKREPTCHLDISNIRKCQI